MTIIIIKNVGDTLEYFLKTPIRDPPEGDFACFSALRRVFEGVLHKFKGGRKIIKRYLVAMMAGLLAVSVTFSIVTPTTAAEKWPSVITIGSFGKVSTSYPTNVAMAKLVTKCAPAKAVVREYAGGAPGMEARVRGDVDTWAVGQNNFYNAYFGTVFSKDKPQGIRLLVGAWYVGPSGSGIRPGEGIHSIRDLAGKNVW
jgi:TRAP-type uncharacterized transport system substrate-binding protein